MFRIDDATAATSIPTPEAAATPGWFTEGNPSTGVPATNVRASWLNGIQEELMSVLTAGGITPSKTVYTNVRDAINAMVGTGRLLRTTVYANASVNTFVPLSQTKTFKVTALGSGGAGGGSPVTNSSQIGGGSGGNSGAYAIGIFTAAQVGASITATVGPVGGGVAGGTGTNGSAVSFGSLMSAPGGQGGGPFGPTSPPINSANGSTPATATGGIINGTGNRGVIAFITSLSVGYSGQGANSPFGAGGGPVNTSQAGQAGVGFGAGGGGAMSLPSNASSLAGGAGSIGFLMIEEFA